MGVWDLFRSTDGAVKRNAPDATPEKNECKNSYNYSAAVFTKIAEAVATPVKNACSISYTYGSAIFSKIDQTVRINGLNKLGQGMRGDETKSKICTYTTKNAALCAFQEGNKLILGTVTKINEAIVTPVKSACRTLYTYISAAFTKIDQIVRINGVYRLAQWIKDDETKSRVGEYTATFMEIAGLCALQEGFNMIPGGVAFSRIVSKTLNDVNRQNININPEKVKLLAEEAGSPQKDLTGGLEIVCQAEMFREGGSYTYGSAAFTKINQTLNRLAQWIADDNTKSKIIVCTVIFAKNAGLYALQQSHKFIPGRGALSRIVSRTLNEFARKKGKMVW